MQVSFYVASGATPIHHVTSGATPTHFHALNPRCRSCQMIRTISYDEEMAAKDAEIAELKEKLSAAPGTHCRSDNADLVTASSDSLPRTTCGASGSRRGKAPPVSPFSGDDGVTHFDDWLLSLERASLWNTWTDEEKLLQLTGHLRGRALQEWNLIPTDDRSTFADADKLHMAVMA